MLSPRKNVDELAVPLADNSAVMVPLLVMVPPLTFTNVPLLVATLVTVPVYWSVLLTVTVVPEMLVVQFVPPATVMVPVSVMAVPAPSSAAGVMLVTVPSYWSVLSTVTVVPETLVVTFVPPEIVNVSVTAVPVPPSAAGVKLDASAQDGMPPAVTVSTWSSVPMVSTSRVGVVSAQ